MALLRWSAIAFIVAILFAILGYGGVASDFAEIAKVLFFIFCVVFVVMLVAGIAIGRKVIP